MALTVSAEDIRDQLGAYLTKPLTLDSGVLSTQQVLSATSLTTGGLNGDFIINANGRILVHDGTTFRVIIGKLT